MGAIASQITSLTIVYSTVYSDADQRNHQSSASLAFVWGIHRGPVKFPAQMASNAENVSIWWRHHASLLHYFLVSLLSLILLCSSLWVCLITVNASIEKIIINKKHIVSYQSGINTKAKDLGTSVWLCYSRAVWSWCRPFVGPISSVPLFAEFFSIVKTHVDYCMPRLYLTGVAVTQPRWHLSNTNVIQIF